MNDQEATAETPTTTPTPEPTNAPSVVPTSTPVADATPVAPNVPDQVQINQILSQIMTDVNVVKDSIVSRLENYDYKAITDHIEAAQDEIAKRLGLEKTDPTPQE